MRAVRVKVIGPEKRVRALLEMCTALLETPTRNVYGPTRNAYGKIVAGLCQKQFCCCQILFSPKWDMKVNILRAHFTIQASPMQNYFSQQLTPKSEEEIKHSSQMNNFLRSQQANRRSSKQLFRITCPIINLWNNLQTVLRRNFFPWKVSKNSEEENRGRKQNTI